MKHKANSKTKEIGSAFSRTLNFLAGIPHRIEHAFGWNTGTCESHWDGDRLMMSFRCGTCGKLQGTHDITHRVNPNARNQFEQKPERTTDEKRITEG